MSHENKIKTAREMLTVLGAFLRDFDGVEHHHRGHVWDILGMIRGPDYCWTNDKDEFSIPARRFLISLGLPEADHPRVFAGVEDYTGAAMSKGPLHPDGAQPELSRSHYYHHGYDAQTAMQYIERTTEE